MTSPTPLTSTHQHPHLSHHHSRHPRHRFPPHLIHLRRQMLPQLPWLRPPPPPPLPHSRRYPHLQFPPFSHDSIPQIHGLDVSIIRSLPVIKFASQMPGNKHRIFRMGCFSCFGEDNRDLKREERRREVESRRDERRREAESRREERRREDDKESNKSFVRGSDETDSGLLMHFRIQDHNAFSDTFANARKQAPSEGESLSMGAVNELICKREGNFFGGKEVGNLEGIF